jgi:antitoxin YefM
MTSISTSYTSHIQAQKDLAKVLDQVEQGDAVVVIQRPGHADVAMIAANELSVLLEEVYLLLEEVYLLRSPRVHPSLDIE